MIDVGLTRAQCRAARAALGWSQAELAQKAGVSRPVVQDFEAKGRVPIANNLKAIRAVLAAQGAEIRADGPGRSTLSFSDDDAEE
jgi:transcriptional regulator with XRE-family HTH domain